jgi:acyl-CoA thioester hydrolase
MTTTGTTTTARLPSTATTRVRVRYAETDKMGVVYHANFFVWFEVGRCEWLRAQGSTYRALEDEGIELPVIEARCVYLRPGHYDDELDVRATARLVSPVQVEFVYEVVRVADGLTLATGLTRHAAINGRGRPCRLPDRIREVLA